MMNRLTECLENRTDNYILPFFWQHGEDDETLLREIDAIEKSGIRALCVESRTHEQFCEDGWWHTMDLILGTCRERNMKVWLLDDKHFPSGYANGIISKKYPGERIWGITERHVDVVGPQKDACVFYQWKTSPDDILLGIIACKRLEDSLVMTGETMDLTGCLSDDAVYFDLPEGCWRIFFLFKTRSGISRGFLEYADKLTERGGDAYLEAVYEPHYAHYKDDFGKTFAGFFSDEPCFGNNTNTGVYETFNLGVKYGHYPYTDEVLSILNEKLDGQARSMLPALWFETADRTMQRVRLAYMDTITALYSKNFTYKLGDWCRAHGVEYIGHIIEDDQQHTATKSSAGHYFRALDGEDMAGIDVVLCQVVPGMTHNPNTLPCSYDICDNDFFHFTLPKLGSSHAHIQKEKKGRAMCEIYGAYGWAEGLKLMKWLTDFMLVRGINRYVPHAFTPRVHDLDCPPHFYANGENPQFPQFRLLMGYMNRVCHIIDGGVHVSSAALLYHAEACWANGNEKDAHMKVDVPARYLTEHQLDYDIISADYLASAVIKNGCLYSADEAYPALIVPAARSLPQTIIDTVCRLAKAGLPVLVLRNRTGEALPLVSETGVPAENALLASGVTVGGVSDLSAFLSEKNCVDLAASGEEPYLRCYHYVHGDTHYCMMTNEGIFGSIDTKVTFRDFAGGDYAVYDAMENKAVLHTAPDGAIPVMLEPYEARIIVFGALPENLPCAERTETLSETPAAARWTVSTAEHAENLVYQPYRTTDVLFNITGKDALPRFSGHIRYETTLDLPALSEGEKLELDLGAVGETAVVTVNGKHVGTRIAPPYRFDVTAAVRPGENVLSVEVVNNLGYQRRDALSRFLLIEPSGLLGPVVLRKKKLL